MSTISRGEAITALGQSLSDARHIMAGLYATGGARAVGEWAAGKDAPEEVIQRKAAVYERWVREEEAKRHRGAA
jgi:hypothetical protein